MTFAVPAAAYDRFMGRYSRPLAPRFVDFAGVAEGPALDVGCGPGSLAAALAERLGPAQVAAADPSESFVEACRARVPGADVRRASGEALPFGDGAFAAALSQLVLSFVKEPDRMAAELGRVVRPGGVVAACTFDAGGFALATAFWDAAIALDPAAPDDARIPFRRLPELQALFARAGFRDLRAGTLDVEARYEDFDEDLWRSLGAGIGPMGAYLAAQPPERQALLRDGCWDRLGRPSGAFTLPARAIAVRARV